MSTHATFEGRVVRAACLFVGEQVPANILRAFINELPAEARADIKAYMVEMLRPYKVLEPVLTTADFATARGGIIDAMELTREMNQRFGVGLTLENNVANAEYTLPCAILATYEETIALM